MLSSADKRAVEEIVKLAFSEIASTAERYGNAIREIFERRDLATPEMIAALKEAIMAIAAKEASKLASALGGILDPRLLGREIAKAAVEKGSDAVIDIIMHRILGAKPK